MKQTDSLPYQTIKQTAETQRLQAAMQAASHNAANDAQSKLKRIQHLERKVIENTDLSRNHS
jgi:hypothetical protein